VKKKGTSTEKKLTSSKTLSPLHPAQKTNLIPLNIRAKATEKETSKHSEDDTQNKISQKGGSVRKYTSLPTVSLAPSYLKKGKGKASKVSNSVCPLNKKLKSKSKSKRNRNDMENELFLESPGSYITIIPYDDSTICIKPAKMEEGAALVTDTCTYAGNDIFSIDKYGLIHAVDMSLCVQSEGSSLILGSCNICSAFFQYDKETYMISLLEDPKQVISAKNGVVSLMHVIGEKMSSISQLWLPIKFYPLIPTISPVSSLTTYKTSKKGIKGGYSKNNKSKSTKAKATKGKTKVNTTPRPTYMPVEYRFVKCIGGDENQDFPHNLGELSIAQCAAGCNASGFVFFTMPCGDLDCWCGGGEWNNNASTVCCSDQRNNDRKNLRNLAVIDETLAVFEITGDSEVPSFLPTIAPTDIPSVLPSVAPSDIPSVLPSDIPSDIPSVLPSVLPSVAPSDVPSVLPSVAPSDIPSVLPSGAPSDIPSVAPSDIPSGIPSLLPSVAPSDIPSLLPSVAPSDIPSSLPSLAPSDIPSVSPSAAKTPITNENIVAAIASYIDDEAANKVTYGPIEDWNVNEALDGDITPVTTGFASLFFELDTFNADISAWDTSSALSLAEMFSYAASFNADISGWDIASVLSLEATFQEANNFNIDISGWDVSSVGSLVNTFKKAIAFNQDIGSWDVSSKCTLMFGTFSNALEFDQDISSWDTSNVTGMFNMFAFTEKFDQDISEWDISINTTTGRMFEGDVLFNQELSLWDIGKVTNFNAMFLGAVGFNQILCWDLRPGAQIVIMFQDCPNGSIERGCFSFEEGPKATNDYTNCFPEFGPWEDAERFCKTESNCTTLLQDDADDLVWHPCRTGASIYDENGSIESKYKPFPMHLAATNDYSNCFEGYGTYNEMEFLCLQEPDCNVLHDYGSDDFNWRACRTLAYQAEGPADTKLKPQPGK